MYSMDIIFWIACLVSFGIGGIMCWAFIARRAIARAYFNGGFDSFPEHFEKGRTKGYADGWADGKQFGVAFYCYQQHTKENCTVPAGEPGVGLAPAFWQSPEFSAIMQMKLSRIFFRF
jgi:hypothetical protein